jgi:hypothetical protein
VTLDFMTASTVTAQHYAFLVDETVFDEVSARLADRGIPTFADPFHREPEYNTHGGGRGRCFDSPDGHNLEILTPRCGRLSGPPGHGPPDDRRGPHGAALDGALTCGRGRSPARRP